MLILYELGPPISKQELAWRKIDFGILESTAGFLTINHDSEFMT
jgi:hypothetical protein